MSKTNNGVSNIVPIEDTNMHIQDYPLGYNEFNMLKMIVGRALYYSTNLITSTLKDLAKVRRTFKGRYWF